MKKQKEMNMMLRPVKCKNTVEIAIENIGNYIAENLRVGDVLPSERELAEQLCISRNITREALQHFRTLGIIESKPKVGATVARLSPGNIYEGYMPFLSTSQHSFKDLAHLRLMLEFGCAEWAIKNVTEEKIKELQELSEKIKKYSEEFLNGNQKSREEMFKADIEFHTELMRLSGNLLIESLIPLVVEFFSKQFLRSITSLNKRTIGYEEHIQMVDALKEKDLEKLTGLIRSHINIYIENYSK